MTKNFVSDALRTSLSRGTKPALRMLLLALATGVFFAFAMNARYAMIDEFSGYRTQELIHITAITFTVIYALFYAIQLRIAKGLSLAAEVLLAVITGAVMLAKISLLDYVSDDYSIFLSNWIYDYSQMGMKEGLGTYIGSDYSPPYLYLLLIISRLRNFPWQYMVKAISVLSDVMLGYGVMRLCSLRVKGKSAQLILLHMTTLLPTVVFNGAYWGQCDGIYVGFCLLALYTGLTGHPVRAMTLFGVALSFKLQTVFFLPVLLPLWLRRDIKLRHVLMIPAAYMVMMIPALWGGKSMHHVLTVYLQQAGNYNFITVNAPNLYQLFPLSLGSDTLYKMFGGMAMLLGFAALVSVCALVCMKKDRLTEESVVLSCLLIMTSVPYFLPKMHERYTFGADVLSLVAAAYGKKRVILPLLFDFASYVAYTAGLPGKEIMDLKWAALIQLAGIVLTAAALVRSLREADVTMEVKA